MLLGEDLLLGDRERLRGLALRERLGEALASFFLGGDCDLLLDLFSLFSGLSPPEPSFGLSLVVLFSMSERVGELEGLRTLGVPGGDILGVRSSSASGAGLSLEAVSFTGLGDPLDFFSFLFFFFFFLSFFFFSGAGDFSFLSCFSASELSDFASSSLLFLPFTGLLFFSFLLLIFFIDLKSPSEWSECGSSFFGDWLSSESLFPPGEYRSLTGASFLGLGAGEFLLGLGEPEPLREESRLSRGDLDLSDPDEYPSCFLGEALLAGEALFAGDGLFAGDSLSGSADFLGEASSSPPDLAGDSSFFTRFFRFTGDVELSDDDEFFRFLVFFFLVALSSLEEPSELLE